jgi:TonB family protein
MIAGDAPAPRRVSSRVVLGGAILAAGAALAAVPYVTLPERSIDEIAPVAGPAGPATIPATADSSEEPSQPVAAPAGGAARSPQGGSRLPDSLVLPLLRLAPIYPKAAREENLEGDVMLEFTITDHGSVEDAVVVDSTDPVFDAAAMVALSRWKYLPRVVNGRSVAQEGVRTVIRFVLQGGPAPVADENASERPPEPTRGIDFDTFEGLIEPAFECLAAQELRCAELVLDEIMATYEVGEHAVVIWEFYGYIFTQYGDYGRAIAAYQSAIDHGGLTQQVSLAHLYFERHQYDMALRTLLDYSERIETLGGRLSPGVLEFIERLRVLGISEDVL